MKLKVLTFLLLILLLYENVLAESSKLSESACEIVTAQFEENSWMKTLAVVEFEQNFQPQVLNRLLKCLPAEVSVISIDASKFDEETQPRIHSPSMVVIAIDEINGNMKKDFSKKPFLDHNSKFLILTTRSDQRFHRPLKARLRNLSIFNYEIIYEKSEIVYAGPYSLNEQNLTKIFGDPLEKLKGHNFNVHYFNQHPTVIASVNQVRSSTISFLMNYAEKDNLELKFTSFGETQDIQGHYKEIYHSRDFEMSLNAFDIDGETMAKLMTYEETGYCIMVPDNKEMSKRIVFFKPFDPIVWLLTGLSMILCMILWRLGGHQTSAWIVPFFFWAFYYGQTMRFPTKRKIFVILLQILVFMLFILGNAYQGVITSLMIQQETPERMKSFDELIESDFKIFTTFYLNSLMMENPKYREAYEHGRIATNDKKFTGFDYDEILKNHTAIVMLCEAADFIDREGKVSNFYIMAEKLFPYFIRLRVIFLSKFVRRLQQIMDWTFEAGLLKHWKKNDRIEHGTPQNELKVLKLEEISSVFFILLINLAFGLLALLFEIFWHDFVKPCYSRFLRWRRGFGIIKRKPIKVRRIKVRPMKRHRRVRVHPIKLND